MSDVLAAYERWEADDSEGYDSLMAIAGAMANELERVQAAHIAADYTIAEQKKVITRLERERDEAQAALSNMAASAADRAEVAVLLRRERDEARALLAECREAITTAQWAVRMLTESATPTAVNRKQLKAEQAALLARLEAALGDTR